MRDRRPTTSDWVVLFLGALVWLLLANALVGQDTTHTRLQRENDSLRTRTVVLAGAVREYILAADHYATQARHAQALLNWYRNRPTHCGETTHESMHPAGPRWRTITGNAIARATVNPTMEE